MSKIVFAMDSEKSLLLNPKLLGLLYAICGGCQILPKKWEVSVDLHEGI